MKTRAMTLILIAILIVSITAGIAMADPKHKATFVVGQKYYTADGVKKQMDAATFIEDGRTFVPVRFLGYAIGVSDKNIGWEAPHATLTMDGITVKLTDKSKTYYVNNKANQMDVTPIIKGGRTYLPARFVAEAFGYQVDWNAGTRTVSVYPPGETPPVVEPPVEPPPVVEPPLGSVEEIIKNARPINGVPLDKSKFDPGPDGYFDYYFEKDGMRIEYTTVDKLKQDGGIKLGKTGYAVILDVKVTKDEVFATMARSDTSPIPIILAEGNMVGRLRDNSLVDKGSYLFTHGYSVYYRGADPGLPEADIHKISHIIFMFGDGMLAVENPEYRGN